ncbi:MAG: hypothetical protein KY476_02175 [Planctomycetes bacterium]|nr:hypothetical protein [Planctomycetota bacterium]
MIPRCLNVVTGLAFAAHALVGCCWHHAHAAETHAHPDEAAHDELSVADRLHGPGVATHHHDDPVEPVDPSHEHEHDTCDAGRCAYVAPDRVELPMVDSGSLFGAAELNATGSVHLFRTGALRDKPPASATAGLAELVRAERIQVWRL